MKDPVKPLMKKDARGWESEPTVERTVKLLRPVLL